MTTELTPLRCELCGGQLHPVRHVPKFGPHPELVTYQCESCRHVVTKPAEEGKTQA